MKPPFARSKGQKSPRSRQNRALKPSLKEGVTSSVQGELSSLKEPPLDLSFPKRVRLRQRRQFMRAQREGIRVKSESFFAYVKPTRAKVVRLGITASKKVGKAHERNRCKRLVREAFRHSELRSMAGFDVVVVVRQESPPRRLDALTGELNKLAQRALTQTRDAQGHASQGHASKGHASKGAVKRRPKKQPARADQGSKTQQLKQPPHGSDPHQEGS